ncbi:MAG: hypothetical protein ACC656_08245 [Candidatus Heimdallarchaeota archaeon]
MSRIKSYNIDGEIIAHDELRITNFDDLNEFLLNVAGVPNEVDEAVYEFLSNTGYNYFQFSGDGDGLGFIVDVFNNRELEGEPVDSLQVWLDEYKEFM